MISDNIKSDGDSCQLCNSLQTCTNLSGTIEMNHNEVASFIFCCPGKQYCNYSFSFEIAEGGSSTFQYGVYNLFKPIYGTCPRYQIKTTLCTKQLSTEPGDPFIWDTYIIPPGNCYQAYVLCFNQIAHCTTLFDIAAGGDFPPSYCHIFEPNPWFSLKLTNKLLVKIWNPEKVWQTNLGKGGGSLWWLSGIKSVSVNVRTRDFHKNHDPLVRR